MTKSTTIYSLQISSITITEHRTTIWTKVVLFDDNINCFRVKLNTAMLNVTYTYPITVTHKHIAYIIN